MYIVYWRSRLTGYEGNGVPVPRAYALDAVRCGNWQHPEIEHWAVRIYPLLATIVMLLPLLLAGIGQ